MLSKLGPVLDRNKAHAPDGAPIALGHAAGSRPLIYNSNTEDVCTLGLKINNL